MNCPHCQQEATEIRAFLFQHGVAYCTSCGWNIERAAEKLRIDLWAMWASCVIGVFLAGVVWIRGGGMGGALAIVAAFIALPVGSILLTRQRLSKIAVGQPHVVTEPPAPSTKQLDDASLPLRPRAVRLTMRGYLYGGGMVLVTAFVLGLFSLILPEIVGVSHTNKTKGLFACLACCWALWLCVSFFMNRIRERRLFMNGEVSQGVILSRSNTGSGRQIVYSYRDGRGYGFRNRATDFSNRLYEEMPIHVFYNPLDSRESAALEASLYEVG